MLTRVFLPMFSAFCGFLLVLNVEHTVELCGLFTVLGIFLPLYLSVFCVFSGSYRKCFHVSFELQVTPTANPLNSFTQVLIYIQTCTYIHTYDLCTYIFFNLSLHI